MTKDEIILMADEAELWLHSDRKYEAVKKFAELVAAAEREECAKVAEEWQVGIDNPQYQTDCATAIRARGQ
jgi:hypothetical protein